MLSNKNPLPMHVTPPVREMLNEFASGLGGLSGFFFRQLLNPVLSPLLMHILGKRVSMFQPLLRNTVSPTILAASDKINVIPSRVVLDLDGRLLPGFSEKEMEQELRKILGEDCTIETHLPYPGPTTSDMGLFKNLALSMRQLDPAGIPVPYVNPAVTDARFFSRLGIQTYGFTPLQLPPGFSFISTIHAADERIPVICLRFRYTGSVFSLAEFPLIIMLPTLDAHAHLDPSRPGQDFSSSGVVLAMGISLAEAELSLKRQDQLVVWGVGCHPRMVRHQEAFDPDLVSTNSQIKPW